MKRPFFIFTAYAFIYHRHDVLRDHQFGLTRSSIGILKPLSFFLLRAIADLWYLSCSDCTWLHHQNWMLYSYRQAIITALLKSSLSSPFVGCLYHVLTTQNYFQYYKILIYEAAATWSVARCKSWQLRIYILFIRIRKNKAFCFFMFRQIY